VAVRYSFQKQHKIEKNNKLRAIGTVSRTYTNIAIEKSRKTNVFIH